MSATHPSSHNGHARTNGSAEHEAGSITALICEQPVTSIAIAAAAGFLFGGGARRSGGLTILALLVQVAMREGRGESSALGDLVGAALGEEED